MRRPRAASRARSLLALATGSLLALSLILAPPSIGAGAQEPPPEEVPEEQAPPPEPPEQSQLDQEYHGVLEAEARVRADHGEAVAKVARLTDEIARLDQELAAAQVELAGAERELATAEAHLLDVEQRLDGSERALDRNRQRLRDQAIEAYMTGGMSPLPRLMPGPEGDRIDFDALTKSRVYAQAVVTDRKQVIERVRELVGSTGALRSEAEQTREVAAGLHDEVASELQRMAERRESQEAARVEATAAAAHAAELAAQLEQERQQYERRYAQLASSSDSIAGLLVRRQRDQEPAASTYGIFLNPVEGARVVSEYGMRLHPILNEWRLHAGLDLDAPDGAPLRASADGEVVVASEQGGYGLTVVIDHGNQLATLYGHMSHLDVGVGDVVRAGDVIGRVGSTGLSTGPHCHWEVRVLGFPVDGTPYLRQE